jgi:DNA-binding SARP family transcriptional activator
LTEPDRTRDLRVQLLGPVRAWLGDREADLGTARRRALFTILALRGGTVVARDELTDGLWANRTPANPAGSIYTYVNGLRDALEPGRDPHTRSSWLVSEAPGYRLRVEESQVDAARFVAHLTMGRALMADDPAAAVVEFDAALALWQPDGGAVKPSGVLSGDPDGGAVKPSGVLSGKNVPLADVDGPFVRAARMQLVEQRFGLVEDRARALIELGRRDDAIPGLLTLTEQYPLREGPRGLLMLALHRDGRTAEALAVFEDLRGVLVEALGVDPSPALSLLRDRIVSDDPALGHGTPGPGEPMPVAPAPSVPGQLPADVATFTGRGTELARLRNLVTGEPSVANTPAIGVISGTAGVGKTALAVRFAHELAGEFPDGQLFVNLRGFDPNEEPASAAQALIRLTNDLGSRPPNEPESEDELGGRYRSLIAGKRMLVVLDNALSSEQVRPLLPGTFSCLVLVTSRNRLAGLVARDGARMLDLGPLPPTDAEHMLATILGAQHADNGTELGKLAECCGHLPLALGIAAHRLTAHPELSAADVVTELSNENDRLRLLSLPGSGAVRQVLSWSYRVLKPQPARLFRLLGLHPSVEISGGAAAALNGTPHAVTRRLLDALVLGNLLERIGRDRSRIHDLLTSRSGSGLARISGCSTGTCTPRATPIGSWSPSAHRAGCRLTRGRRTASRSRSRTCGRRGRGCAPSRRTCSARSALLTDSGWTGTSGRSRRTCGRSSGR